MASRPPPNRSTDAQIFIRCSAAQKRALEEATEIESAKLPTGARLPVSAFALGAALEKAKALGVELPEQKRGKGGSSK